MELSAYIHTAAVLTLQKIPGTPLIGGWTRNAVWTFKWKEQHR